MLYGITCQWARGLRIARIKGHTDEVRLGSMIRIACMTIRTQVTSYRSVGS